MNDNSKNKKNIIVLASVSVALVMLLIAGTVIYNFVNKNKEDSFHAVHDEDASESIPENIELVPDFTVYDYDGNKVKLSDYFGKPIVINFWATWCGPCKSEMPGFENLYKKYKDKVVFMMINSSDSREDVSKFLKQYGYIFPVYYDDTRVAASIYGVSAIPATYVTDKYGQLYGYQIGVLPEEALEGALKTVLGEE